MARRFVERRRAAEVSDRKSPPFAERREGWGTLKYMRWAPSNGRNPRAQSRVTVPHGAIKQVGRMS